MVEKARRKRDPRSCCALGLCKLCCKISSTTVGIAQALSASFLFQLDAKYAALRVHTAAAQHMKKTLTPMAFSAASTPAAKHMSVRQLDADRARASRPGLRSTGAISESTARCCGTSVPFPVERLLVCILASPTMSSICGSNLGVLPYSDWYGVPCPVDNN